MESKLVSKWAQLVLSDSCKWFRFWCNCSCCCSSLSWICHESLFLILYWLTDASSVKLPLRLSTSSSNWNPYKTFSLSVKLTGNHVLVVMSNLSRLLIVIELLFSEFLKSSLIFPKIPFQRTWTYLESLTSLRLWLPIPLKTVIWLIFEHSAHLEFHPGLLFSLFPR